MVLVRVGIFVQQLLFIAVQEFSNLRFSLHLVAVLVNVGLLEIEFLDHEQFVHVLIEQYLDAGLELVHSLQDLEQVHLFSIVVEGPKICQLAVAEVFVKVPVLSQATASDAQESSKVSRKFITKSELHWLRWQ